MAPIEFNGIDLSKITDLDQIDSNLVNRVAGSLTTMQTLSMMVHGSLEIGELKMENWKAAKMFYLLKCPSHGYHITYATGFYNILQCILCIREEYQLKKETLQPNPNLENI
jgi:hypothetical protein